MRKATIVKSNEVENWYIEQNLLAQGIWEGLQREMGGFIEILVEELGILVINVVLK